MSHIAFSESKLAIRKPWLQRINPGWLIALLPLALTLYFAGLISRGGPLVRLSPPATSGSPVLGSTFPFTLTA